MAAAEPELGWSVQTEDQVQQHLLVHRTTSQARKLPTIYIYIYLAYDLRQPTSGGKRGVGVPETNK